VSKLFVVVGWEENARHGVKVVPSQNELLFENYYLQDEASIAGRLKAP